MEATAKGSGGDGGESEREKPPPFVRRGGQRMRHPAGAGQFWSLVRTDHVSRPDTLMVMVGGVGHFLLIIS